MTFQLTKYNQANVSSQIYSNNWLQIIPTNIFTMEDYKTVQINGIFILIIHLTSI